MEIITNTYNNLKTNDEKIRILHSLEFDEETIKILRTITKQFSEQRVKDYNKNYYKEKYNKDPEYKEKMKLRARTQYKQNKELLKLTKETKTKPKPDKLGPEI